ncbi:dihydroxyacetone kinase [Neoasaia chiangmaiensis NBRC 101099]|uniref:Dihydroxyacetone kinase n=1 Tax=Neoasaia chiangmaiensis TaxID=320497 RepID=A0A1U9KU17_9PROT|nr:dihydroxyacetone kinase subunit DhaK [Neoasaia chiangmaiensis]AQS89344.1 dihydroxyacetone kinase [Neoasaia chiangmaiensis]GBR42039.1 dihydroxyacetone kinase [Neoasaia chiangmaiensis NBRC 101099]GEN14203.1 dihydroxyacetone kinase [Neoasaia chiangmaiensis]
MKRFYNHRDSIVTEAIDGLLRSSAGAHLCRLKGHDNIHVVLRRDWDKSKVAIVSGGGSGHEPAHAGFVGRGMLTAAVCGALFASPGVDAILAAILAVTGEAGCLLVVKNYTGDRLNFGLAAEQARALGHKVELVIVADDVALERGGNARGIAGTVLVQKVAGYAAEKGATLAAVTQTARDAIGATASIGLALTDVNVYDPEHETRLEDGEAELGLGIHGEPGAERIDMARLDDLVVAAAEKLAEHLTGDRQVLMVNLLGAVPVIEAQAILDAVSRTDMAQRLAFVVGPAPLMTSLDMNGFSLSAIPATAAFTEALQADVEPAAWPGIAAFEAVRTQPVPALPETFIDAASKNPTVEALIRRGAKILVDNEKELNALDARIGDGDAGSTFAESARVVLKDIDRLPLASPRQLCATIGRLLARNAGGSSGVLLSIMFAAAGQQDDWRAGLQAGVRRMQDYGGASEGDRTMLDALIPAVAALQKGDLGGAATAARKGADATRDMPARAGRAAYVPEEQLRAIPDPGAEAIARLLEGLTHAG